MTVWQIIAVVFEIEVAVFLGFILWAQLEEK